MFLFLLDGNVSRAAKSTCFHLPKSLECNAAEILFQAMPALTWTLLEIHMQKSF